MARSSRAKPFYTLDCETDPFKAGRVPRPFVWGLYDGATETYDRFDTVDEVIDRLEHQEVVVYAHNGGKFDYHYFPKERINTDELISVINGRMARFRIGECEFRDSVNLLPIALKQFEKEKIDYKLMEPGVRDEPNNRALIERYLRSDCVNLWNLLHEYFKTYGRGLTTAGTAMKVWTKMTGIKKPNMSPARDMMYREFYYGGRVECFKTGHERHPFKLADINGAYPRAMREQHPISIHADLSDRLPPEAELHRCFIKLNAISKGAFPWRDENDNNALHFPCDERKVREYKITGWELIEAFKHDAVKIIDIKEVHYFSQTINFTEYVEYFAEIRRVAKLKEDKANDIFGKLMGNSLYGKFGSDPERYKEYMIATEDSLQQWEADGWNRDMEYGKNFLIARDLSEENQRRGFINVATAASITGFVRATMFKSLQQCSNVMYCDTDSIAAYELGHLDIGDGPGQWKLEMIGDEYAIAGKKLYAFHKENQDRQYLIEDCPFDKDGTEIADIEKFNSNRWKLAHKGVRMCPQDIIDVCYGIKKIYNPKVPTYSILKSEPVFTAREVRMTHKRIESF